MAEQLRVNDVGSTIRLRVLEDGAPLDLSTATMKKFEFRKPTGVQVSTDAAFMTNGEDGVLEYVTVVGFLDTAGPWFVQVHFSLGADTAWRTDPFTFEVGANV